MRTSVNNLEQVNNSNLQQTPNSATTMSIFKFTEKYGGFFSSKRIDDDFHLAQYHNYRFKKPLNAYGHTFAEAMQNLMSWSERVIRTAKEAELWDNAVCLTLKNK